MIEQLRSKAKELLETKAVAVVIGYGEGSVPGATRPVFIVRPEDVGKLIWNARCANNLTRYLTRKEVLRLGKPAVVVKGCDAKAAVALAQESQVPRENVILLGVVCPGLERPAGDQCRQCEVNTPPGCDFVFGEKIENQPDPAQAFLDVAEIEKLAPEERRRFWAEEFERCIRCYACRNVCPLCYCERCVADMNQPQWIETSAHERGNFAWNIVRALHLAGRCIGCGACERACPMGIPLMRLNRKLAKVVLEKFGYRSGSDPKARPAMASFKPEDPNDIFR